MPVSLVALGATAVLAPAKPVLGLHPFPGAASLSEVLDPDLGMLLQLLSGPWPQGPPQSHAGEAGVLITLMPLVLSPRRCRKIHGVCA